MEQSKNRKVLVIGGAGYIGSVLVGRLLDSKDNVVALDNFLYNNQRSLTDIMDQPSFSFIQGDFCDNAILDKAMKGVTDVVLLAALVGDPMCKKYPDEAKRINLDGSINLIKRLNSYPLDNFVFLSTCSNYGLRDTDEPADEKAELNPKSLYAETKVGVEQYLCENSDNLSYDWTILRSATAFGLSPRMRFDLTISEFTRELALGRELLVYDADTWRPYCHVDDISTAIIKVLEVTEKKASGQIFNVGSNNENHTKKSIVDIISTHLKDGHVKYVQGGRDPRNYRVNFDKISRVFDFQAERTVEDSVIELIKNIKAGCFVDIESKKNFFGNYFMNQ
ncbi:MAG: NAD(P)-dependent oxidoreductase [candidate division Zixibacteria bacterium]|nr:NAD(P)-dependent oxidoreductase [candidate division Zixibacteria bacterium]